METTRLSARLHRAASEQLCPECSSPMIEVDRLNESEGMFIWYQCSKDNCNGQWLQKKLKFDIAI